MLPTLSFLADTSLSITLTNGIDRDGAPIPTSEFAVLSRLNKANSRVNTKDGQKFTLTAKAFIFERFDMFPDNIQGACTDGITTYQIIKGNKSKNPDGSINHIVLELV